MTESSITFRRFFFFGSFIFLGWYLFEHRALPGTWYWPILGFLFVGLMATAFIELKHSDRLNAYRFTLPRPLAWLICFALLSTPFFLSYFFGKSIFQNSLERILFLFWISSISAWILYSGKATREISTAFVTSLLLGGLIYRVGLYLPEISSSIFSRGWSEGSRYFNASMFFSSKIYGEHFPLPVLHPTRYLLQALPFLFAPHQILIHRIWQALLWIGLTGAGAYSLARRFSGSKLYITLLTTWLFLFFFQGAVYYHLIVCALIVFAGFDIKKPWRTWLLVVAASLWAGISRLNWMPVPALLATVLYLLETRVEHSNLLKYLKFPLIWCVSGAISALLANRIYIIFSGNDPALFSSSLQSYMLWHRLLPNSTYSFGILLGLLIVILPLALMVCQKIWVETLWKKIHWLRILGLTSILLVFALGGIIVSVKVGGGGDLHNLDALLVLWACVSLYFLHDQVKLESGSTAESKRVFPALVLLACVIPVLFVVINNASLKTRDPQREQTELILLQAVIDKAKQQPGTPLFISETQLLAFGAIQNVEPVSQYEKVFLMEMVMSQNSDILETLQQEFSQQKFSVIVTDTVWIQSKDIRSSFWVENNLWVDEIVAPMLADYEPILSLENGSIHVLIPTGQRDFFKSILETAPAEYVFTN